MREAGGEEAASAAAVMERSAYNRAIAVSKEKGTSCSWSNPRFVRAYESCVLFCAANMPGILQALRTGGCQPADSASLTHRELRPEVWAELLAEKRVMDENAMVRPKANTSAFVCSRCRSRECYFHEMQTRSADEPMTIFVTCLDCDHKWRLG
jgi:transcription elongation factor S-II